MNLQQFILANIPLLLRKVEESMKIIGREMLKYKKTQIELLEIENTMSEMKNSLNGISKRLDFQKKDY